MYVCIYICGVNRNLTMWKVLPFQSRRHIQRSDLYSCYGICALVQLFAFWKTAQDPGAYSPAESILCKFGLIRFFRLSFLHQSIPSPVYFFIYTPFISLYLSSPFFIYLLICLFICVSPHLFISLSTYLFISSTITDII